MQPWCQREQQRKRGRYQGTVPLRGAPVPLSLPLAHSVVASILVPGFCSRRTPPAPCTCIPSSEINCRYPTCLPACFRPSPGAWVRAVTSYSQPPPLPGGSAPKGQPCSVLGWHHPCPKGQPRSAPFSARNNRCSAARLWHPGQSPARVGASSRSSGCHPTLLAEATLCLCTQRNHRTSSAPATARNPPPR